MNPEMNATTMDSNLSTTTTDYDTTTTIVTTPVIVTVPVVDPVEGDLGLIMNDSIGTLNITAVEYVPVVAAVTVFSVLLAVGAIAILLFFFTLVYGRRKINEYPFFVIVWHVTLANAAYVLMCITSILPSMLFEAADPDNSYYKWASRIMETADQALLYLTLLMTINRFCVFCIPQIEHIFNKLSLMISCLVVWAYVLFIVTWNVNFGVIRKFDRKKITMGETLLGSNPLTKFFTLSSTVVPLIMLAMYGAVVVVIMNRRRLRRDQKTSRQDMMLLWQALAISLALEVSKVTSVVTPLIAATTWAAWCWTIFSYSTSIINQILNPLLFLVMNQMIRGMMVRMLVAGGKGSDSLSDNRRVVVVGASAHTQNARTMSSQSMW